MPKTASLPQPKRSLKLPPVNRTIIKPKGGWKERTYYAVLAAFNPTNIVHRAIFYSGYLHVGGKFSGPKGTPAGYNQIWSPSYSPTDNSQDREIDRLHYLKVLCEIPELGEP